MNQTTHQPNHLAQQGNLSARHYPVLYLALLAIFACLAYVWILLPPFAFLFFLVYIPFDFYQAGSHVDYSFILLEACIAGIAGWISYEMLKLKIDYPAGRPLTRDEAPDLRIRLEALSKKYNAPQISSIRIVRDCSMELVRTPANGFPFLCSYSLLIGLPLMQSLDSRYLMTAIEREIISLSVMHKHPATWLCFAGQQWSQYQIAWQKSWSASALMMRAFFSWYAPLYKLLSQSACCMQQYHADQKVHLALRDETLVHMLITANISNHYLKNEFWPNLYSKAYRHKQPPYFPYTSLDHNLRAKLDEDKAQAWLNAEMKQASRTSATPTLRQRLEQLGIYHADLPPTVTESAAKYFLGSHLKIIASQLDQIWLKTHEYEWQQKYQQGLQQQQQLRSLISQAMRMCLTNATAWELIQLSKRYQDQDHNLPICK
ncbi:MAG: hypothetical protein QG652_1491, partial [Pseudomonadota bacterium]|nr:hypothetical protein [Pseudomonadota bacterium]